MIHLSNECKVPRPRHCLGTDNGQSVEPVVSTRQAWKIDVRIPRCDGPFERLLEEAAREALIAHFEKLGLQFSNLHPTIQAIMERAAISTGDAARQVESFVRLVAMADQFNLT